ncbi:PEP-CTERM sorting domain-containing protein [Pleurocapsales cyanobacterium LEGE 06147]|nr:PEP-CTERM sorting domain-containing protein [Pleurocapsales cyanobacterium LEGE 06147]
MTQKLPIATLGAAFIAIGSAFVNTPSANAAIFSLDDSHSWATGSDTLGSILGFSMVNVPDPELTPLTSVTTLFSPLGDLTFSPEIQYRQIGSTWKTWSGGYQGEVYSSDGKDSITINLPSNIAAFDFYVQPNEFSLYEITVTAASTTGATTSLLQEVLGDGGAKYFGFYTTGQDLISNITVTANSKAAGFGIGELYLASAASKPVPEPASVLGLLAFGLFGAASTLKHKKSS